jgi:soluble lytic murein transglycosylase-like protein
MRVVTSELRKTVLAALLAASGPPSFAADAPEVASSRYRLNTSDPGVYRLQLNEAAAATVPARSGPAAGAPKWPFAEFVERAAREADLDPALVHAVIHVESRYDPRARSPKGAVGLMQVMPATAARYGVTDPARSIEENLKAGTRYLRNLIEIFDRRLDLVLAAYNAGENAVVRHGLRIPPYRETLAYVPAVLAKYREWQVQAAGAVDVRRRIEYLPGTLLSAAGQASLQP